jgi:hypothetical protein
MTDRADKCPMMLLEIEVGRHCGTTFDTVADGLARAGVMKGGATVINREDATDEQVERLKDALMGQLIYMDEEEREEDYETIRRRLIEAQVTIRQSADATIVQAARRLAGRMQVLLDVVAEHHGPQRKMAREVSKEMAREMRNECEELLKL